MELIPRGRRVSFGEVEDMAARGGGYAAERRRRVSWGEVEDMAAAATAAAAEGANPHPNPNPNPDPSPFLRRVRGRMRPYPNR